MKAGFKKNLFEIQNVLARLMAHSRGFFYVLALHGNSIASFGERTKDYIAIV